MATPVTEIVTIDNMRINQTVAGEGELIVFVTWLGCEYPSGLALADALVRHGYRCYALDMPGFGDSDAPPQAWSVIDYANFVIKYLDYHNLQQVYLFGHSFGGRLGLILGAEYGNRIKKMVLSNSAGIVTPSPLWPQIRLNTYKAIRNTMNAIGLKSLSENLRQRYNQRYASSDFQQVSGAMRETFVKVINQDLLDYAARVQPGTLLFWGDKDEETPLWMGEKLEQTIPDAGLVVHQGAGHYAYLDNLADTVRVMDYFFKQVEGATN